MDAPTHCLYVSMGILFVYSILYQTQASGGFDDVVRELLGAGAEVNRTNDKGITPL